MRTTEICSDCANRFECLNFNPETHYPLCDSCFQKVLERVDMGLRKVDERLKKEEK